MKYAFPMMTTFRRYSLGLVCTLGLLGCTETETKNLPDPHPAHAAYCRP